MPRVRVGGGWNTYTALADTRSGLGGFDYSGLVARDRAGKLWVYHSDYSGPTTSTPVGGGWNIYTMLF